MTNKLLKLYKTCFPDIIRGDHTIKSILGNKENNVIVMTQNDIASAAAVFNKNTIFMLCVLPELRNIGIGSALLKAAEKRIKGAGFDTANFLDGITPGIPMYEGNKDFFVKRGYAHTWGETECVDMGMELSDFSYNEHTVGDTINGVTYRWALPEDYDGVISCTENGCPEFTVYYSSKDMYGVQSGERVLIAVRDEKICAALMVGIETEDTGSLGCTVTREEYRRRGMATNMVKLATGYLKSEGFKKGFLAYTYTDLIPMYSKSGYKVIAKYFMGEKKL